MALVHALVAPASRCELECLFRTLSQARTLKNEHNFVHFSLQRLVASEGVSAGIHAA
jgi:hypothetical protein